MSRVPTQGGSDHILKALAAWSPEGVTSKSLPAQSSRPLMFKSKDGSLGTLVCTSIQYQPGPMLLPHIWLGTLKRRVKEPSGCTGVVGVGMTWPAKFRSIISAPGGKLEPDTVTVVPGLPLVGLMVMSGKNIPCSVIQVSSIPSEPMSKFTKVRVSLPCASTPLISTMQCIPGDASFVAVSVSVDDAKPPADTLKLLVENW